MSRGILFVAILFGFSAQGTCPPGSQEAAEQKIERVNRRYNDFFKYRREEEARLEKIQKGADQVKIVREIHEKELERARQEYKRTPKDYAREEALRIQWEKTEKERARKIELARLCEVQQREAVEETLKKGRQIPPMKEFDLEDY